MKVFKGSSKRNLYAINDGVYIGEFFLLMEKKKDNYIFLSLPDKFVREVPEKEFKEGIEKNILICIKTLPRNVYDQCVEEYKALKK